MVRERVADNVYLFTSERYASVNAGAVVGPEWSVVIDTLAFPDEAREMRSFLEERLGTRIRYVINTHYHADHSFGTCWFPGAIVLSHALCRELLDTRGRVGLKSAQQQNRELQNTRIVLPDIVFDESDISLKVGKRVLRLIHLPGHSEDGTGVLIEDDRVLFAGDVMMPVPHVVDGDFDVMLESMKWLPKLKLESLVQGHGDVILRGEIQAAVRANISYLRAVAKHVRQAGRRKDPYGYLENVTIEECGKSRILLNGLAGAIHRRNLSGLLQTWYPEKAGN